MVFWIVLVVEEVFGEVEVFFFFISYIQFDEFGFDDLMFGNGVDLFFVIFKGFYYQVGVFQGDIQEVGFVSGDVVCVSCFV